MSQLPRTFKSRIERVITIDSPVAGLSVLYGLVGAVKSYPCAGGALPRLIADLVPAGSVIRDVRAAAMSVPTFAMTNAFDPYVPEFAARLQGVRGVTYNELASAGPSDRHGALLRSSSSARRPILVQTIGP